MSTTTNALGKRVLDRYRLDPPTATWAQVEQSHTLGWISDADFEAASTPPDPPQAEQPAEQPVKATAKKTTKKKT